MTLEVDAGIIGDTASNLQTAANEEMTEGVEQYTEAAKVADEEGFPEIAEHFRSIAEIENHHRMRFLHYLEQVKNGTVWKRDKPIQWQCLVCGYIYEGTEPPRYVRHATIPISITWPSTTSSERYQTEHAPVRRHPDSERGFFMSKPCAHHRPRHDMPLRPRRAAGHRR